jgi:Peptidase family M1 domain
MLVPLMAAAACAAPPPRAAPRADRPRYDLTVRVEPGYRRVTGDVRVRFRANRGTDRLVFRLWPNGPLQRRGGQRLDTGPVTRAGRMLDVTRPDPTTLVVHLRRRLEPGASVTVAVPWTLRVPARGRDRIARYPGGLRLGSFFPILAWNPDRGWATDPPARILGESSTSPTADFVVRVHAPAGSRVLVSGAPAGNGVWHATAVRDVGLAVGRFALAVGTARTPTPVTVRVAVPRSATITPATALRLARTSIERLSRLYGAYPWATYTVVFPADLHREGIEYPTLTFVGDVLVSPIAAHETAHQWFYSLVGNDQARDPWLDEALATWAQERLTGTIRYDLSARNARHVGAPMSYWSGKERRYFTEVYGGGVLALRSLGPPALVDCALRAYAARNAYRIAEPADLIAALSAVIPGAETRLRRFGIHR